MNYVQSFTSSDLRFQQALAAFNRRRLTPTCGTESWQQDLNDERAWRFLEGNFVAECRAEVFARAARVPTQPDEFVSWFEALERNGPGQHDPLFPWLEQYATLPQMAWFLTQEAAGEAGFDDLVAMTQVKLPTRAKLEMARNYWDEMGQGNRSAMHGEMLSSLTDELRIDPESCEVSESLALGNLMTALAGSRSLAFQSVGALGVIELTAPDRARCVHAGLKRLGVAGSARRYFALHATLDIKHSVAWNREVLRTLVEHDPKTAVAMAEGALMRLEAGRRCFERYRAQLFGRESESTAA